MRIHRLCLRQVKGVEDRDVRFPDGGVVVLEGPNEVGKTTMLEALDVLLEEKDSSRKRHVLALRPVGRDVPTSIEAELSSGRYRFRYRKQWFRQPATELHVTAPRVEQLTGVAAHERVAQIIAETTDVPLWRALRLMQAAPLAQVDLGGSAALATALDRAALDVCPPDRSALDGPGEPGAGEPRAGEPRAGEPWTGEGGDGLMVAVEEERARYFTPGRGQPTGDYRAALEAVEAAAEADQRAAAAVAEVEADVERHAQLAGDARRATAALEAARTASELLQAQAADVASLQAAHQAAQGQVEAADRELTRARERAQERARLVADLAQRAAAVTTHEATAADLADELGSDEARLAPLVAEHAAAIRTVAALAASVRRAELADDARRAAGEARALAERVARAETVDRERREAAAELAGVAVDKQAVRRLERACTALDVARAQVAADCGRVSVVALAQGQAVIADGVEMTLGIDESYERALEEPVEIVVPGRLAFRLRPESGAAARRATVEAAEREAAEALAAAGVGDLAEARDRLDRRRVLADRLERRTDRLADVLGGSSLEVLRDELAAAEARCAAHAARTAGTAEAATAEVATRAADSGTAIVDSGTAIVDSGTGTVDAVPAADDGAAGDGGTPGTSAAGETGDLAALRSAHATAADAVVELTARVEALRGTVESARVAHTRQDSTLTAARTELAAARDWLDRMRETDPDEALTEAVAAAEALRGQAHGRLAECRSALAGVDAEQVLVRRDAAAAAVRAAAERCAALRDQRLAIEARLEQSGRQGRYDAREAARGALEHAQRRLTSVTRRAEAARRLFDTLQAHRAATQRRYVAPFAEAIGRLGRVVYGSGLDVDIGDDLAIQARVLDGERIEYDALSTGAKEQLAILTRLAVATLVDPSHGVPVVIDDALGYSDPTRLSRMAAAFSLVGSQAQVILLTCTPGRYDGIVGAEVIRLEDIDAAARMRAVG